MVIDYFEFGYAELFLLEVEDQCGRQRQQLIKLKIYKCNNLNNSQLGY